MQFRLLIGFFAHINFAYPSSDMRVGITWKDRMFRKGQIQSARRAGRAFEQNLDDMSVDELMQHIEKAKQMRLEREARLRRFEEMLMTVNAWTNNNRK